MGKFEWFGVLAIVGNSLVFVLSGVVDGDTCWMNGILALALLAVYVTEYGK
tara:strand:+ start:2240 stop:2392 length:153 start_codon:yes stop_codon:yes gene_type:complete